MNGRVDSDKIEVGKYEGRFGKLMLVVLDGDLEMIDFAVKFHHGDPFHPEVNAFFRADTRTRAIDQYLPHRSRRDPDEVPLVMPRRAGVGQPQVDLVHERGRLKRLPRRLAAHVCGREPPQLVVHTGGEIVCGGRRRTVGRRHAGWVVTALSYSIHSAGRRDVIQ